jgi:hypothetical protein
MVKEGRKFVYFYNPRVKKWFKAKKLKSGRLRIVGTVSESEVKGVKKARKARNRNVYLGKRVPDRGEKGLDTLSEVRDICKAILEDYKKKRIPYATAMRRLVFLETTVIPRDSKMSGEKKKKALRIVDEYKKRLMRLKR